MPESSSEIYILPTQSLCKRLGSNRLWRNESMSVHSGDLYYFVHEMLHLFMLLKDVLNLLASSKWITNRLYSLDAIHLCEVPISNFILASIGHRSTSLFDAIHQLLVLKRYYLKFFLSGMRRSKLQLSLAKISCLKPVSFNEPCVISFLLFVPVNVK